MYELLYESCIWHSRVALFDGEGRLVSVHYDDVLRPFLDDTIILGRVRKIAKGLDAAFVDIGHTHDGFLPLNTVSSKKKPLHEGQEIMVRITRAPVGEKGAKLDGRVLTRRPEGDVKIPSIITPAPPAISRSLRDAGDNPVKIYVIDARFKQEVLHYVREDNVFELDKDPDNDILEQIDIQLDESAGPLFNMKGGGRLYIEMTKALTSIDVDSSNTPGMSRNYRLEVNKRAAREVLRLSMLLELGGSILVDFLSLSSEKERQDFQVYLESVFSYDMTEHEVMPISRSGLVEIVRKRVGEDLMTRLHWPMYVAGDILLKLWRKPHYKNKVIIEAHPDVASILRERLTFDTAITYLGVHVDIREKDDMQIDGYRMSGAA